MRIGVDLDGVCHSFHQSFSDYLSTIEHGWDILEKEPGHWNFYRDWGMTDEEFIKTFDDGVEAGYIFRGNVHDGTKEAVQKIKAAGHQVFVITNRFAGFTPQASETATIEWLEENDIPYDELIFSADKTVVYTDMMVEDNLSNYDDLVEAGTVAYLINRPWNQPSGDGRIRINDISEFADCVLAFDKARGLKI